MAHPRRFLVLDAYPREGRAALRDAGGTEAGHLYERMLNGIVRDVRVHVAFPADGDLELPAGSGVADFDAVCWTGSSLTIHADDDPRVRRQVELAREIYRLGTPSFGSCWAAQIATVAAGGDCGENPRGREFGVARQISLSTEGRAHPLFRGKPPLFDALTSHRDHVTKLPRGATLLASNGFSRVQALCIDHDRGSFWSVQYHPEYDLHEVASLCRLRAGELVTQGTFASAAAANAYIADLEALHADPARADLVARLELSEDVLDPAVRTREVRNWIELQLGS